MANDKNELNIRSTVPFHLKDGKGKAAVMFDLFQTFKFYPKQILIQKVAGQNNRFILSAVIEDEVAIEELSKKGGANG
jgi:hypothetical protein